MPRPFLNVTANRRFLMRSPAWRFVARAFLAASTVAAAPVAAQHGPPSLAPVAERLVEAVVNISSTQIAKRPDSAQSAPLPNVPKGSPFEEFFDEFFDKRGGAPADRRVSSLGSGFVIDGREGLIVTNNHVIEGADEIVVNFSNGTKLKVDKILGRDTKTDLALLKVTPKTPLPAVVFGDSTPLKPGDWVMAIGNPFGLGGSVTVGIISATQRDINSGPYDDFLQTDAAINKGNSGGPLFNMEGEVIGVNTAIISSTGTSVGIGFAVPSEIVKLVVAQLKEFGATQRGWLGVKIQSVSEEIAESFGMPSNVGALVSGVTPGGPAALAGFEIGDLIVRFDGKDVTRVRGLPRLVAQTPIGKTIDVDIVRKGEKTTVKVAVGRLAEDEEKFAPLAQTPEAAKPLGKGLMGLALAPLTGELRQKFGLGADVNGVLVTAIDPESPAAQKNIKPGDVIVEAAQERVSTLSDLAGSMEKVKKLGRASILLRVEDGAGDLRFVALPVE